MADPLFNSLSNITQPFANIAAPDTLTAGARNPTASVSPFQNPSGVTSPFQSPSAPSPFMSSQQGVSSPLMSRLPSPMQSISPTPSGGVAFHPDIAAGYKSAATPTPQPSTKPGLGSFVTQTQNTPSGTVSTTGAGGVSGYTNPNANFFIDTSNVPSSALGSSSSGDLAQKYKSYQDYVNAVSATQGYSQNYINALNQQYGAQTQGAALGLQQAQINSNFYTGQDLPGDTINYAQGATSKALAQNTLEQARNSIQQLSANQALNTQALSRTGDIAAAQTQLQYNPTAISAQNAIGQYNALQQAHPDAGIPQYNPSGDPLQQQQMAMNLVQRSPSYQSQFQSTYTTPGGGTGIYSKLNLQGLQQNQDGSYTLVPAAAAALGSAQSNVINSSLQGLSNINAAVESSSKTLSTTKQFMTQYGINDNEQPIVNQLQNAIKAKTAPAAALAAFRNDLTALRSDYSQYLTARSGSSIAGTGPDSPEVLNALPDTISYSGIAKVVGEMQKVGDNTASSLGNQLQQAMRGLQSGTVQSTSGTSQGSQAWPGWNP